MAGSIEKRGENSYRLVVSAGKDSKGKRKKYRRTVKVEGKTEAAKIEAAEIELAKFIAEIEGENFVEPSKVTFKAFSEKWLNYYPKANNLAPKTTYNYKLYLDKHILPWFGHIKLSKIVPINFVEFYKYLQQDYKKADGKPLSNNSIIKFHKLLNLMFNTAKDWKLIKTNPLESVSPPKYIKPVKTSYTAEEAKKLMEALKGEPVKYQAAIITALGGGFRLGEVTGLRWSSIDFENNIIHIEQSSQYIPGMGVFTKEPKTEKSKRAMEMADFSIKILKLHQIEEKEKRLKCGKKWEGGDFETGFVFTQWNGRPMHPDTPSKWFNKFLKRKGLKKITFHELRHTAATLLIDSGEITIKELSEWLGHSDTNTTTRIYIHDLDPVKKAPAKIMNKVFKIDSEPKNTDMK